MNKTAEQVAQMATNALLYEVNLYPKPGLVDPIDNGAHHDMDVNTFIRSATALTPSFYQFTLSGLTFSKTAPLTELFEAVRRIGQQAEKDMFAATLGINTHKGAIFSFALFCAGIGYTLNTEKTILPQWTEQLTTKTFQTIQAMTIHLDQDFQNLDTKPNLTYGEKLYLDYGIKGIRGEAASGYPALQTVGLPFMRQTQEVALQQRLLDLFLTLLVNTTDSNIIHRSNLATLTAVQKDAAALIAKGGAQKLGRQPFDAMNQAFVKLNISPGGTADLIAASVFFGFLEQLF